MHYFLPFSSSDPHQLPRISDLHVNGKAFRSRQLAHGPLSTISAFRCKDDGEACNGTLPECAQIAFTGNLGRSLFFLPATYQRYASIAFPKMVWPPFARTPSGPLKPKI